MNDISRECIEQKLNKSILTHNGGKTNKKIKLKGNSKMEINASVTNVYNRANVFYIDRISNTRVNQLPILPSVGFSWKF